MKLQHIEQRLAELLARGRSKRATGGMRKQSPRRIAASATTPRVHVFQHATRPSKTTHP